MLSSELEFCLNEAFQGAREGRHEFMTVEHLLLALLDVPRVIEILKGWGADVERLRQDLIEFVDQTTPRLDEEDERETHGPSPRVRPRLLEHRLPRRDRE